MNSGRKRRARKLSIKARKLPPDSRTAFLEKQCGGDAELREAVENRLRSSPSNKSSDSGKTKNTFTDSAVTSGILTTVPETPVDDENRGWTNKLFGGPLRRVSAVFLTLVVLAGLALIGHRGIQMTRNGQFMDRLMDSLNANAQAAGIWAGEQLNSARLLANDVQLRGLLEELSEIASGEIEASQPLWEEESRDRLQELLQPFSEENEAAFALCFKNQDGILIAESPQWIGRRAAPETFSQIGAVFGGRTSLIQLSPAADSATGQGDFYAIAPIRSDSEEIIAAIGVRQSNARAWARLLNVARAGASWRNFAFDSRGRLIAESSSYNDESLLRLGVSRNQFPRLLLGDSGDPSTFQSTRMKVKLRPYRDYRGTNVIGAWRWLPEYGFGLAVEADASEAFAPWRQLEMGAGVLLLVLAFSIFGALFCAFAIARAPAAASRPRDSEQYSLVEKTGERGFAEIYLAKHPLLLKPVSMLILNPDVLTPGSMKRLERDAAIASQLTHPNTAEIYDFGKTPFGGFFCVTEHAAGFSFEEWRQRDEALLPERVIYILRQVCESLSEAHAAGLFHRSIKPSSLTLCRRGGKCDFVKVLDYGLSVDLPEDQSYEITSPFLLKSDLVFVAPEGIRSLLDMDARADIYSLGAVAYYLLTGKHLFELTNNLDLQVKIVNERPTPLSEAASQKISKELEELITACLNKDPLHRPQDVVEVLNTLNALQSHLPWSEAQARECWERYDKEETPAASTEDQTVS